VLFTTAALSAVSTRLVAVTKTYEQAQSAVVAQAVKVAATFAPVFISMGKIYMKGTSYGV
jgi:hypothetical protein